MFPPPSLARPQIHVVYICNFVASFSLLFLGIGFYSLDPNLIKSEYYYNVMLKDEK